MPDVFQIIDSSKASNEEFAQRELIENAVLNGVCAT
jgi:hypothetical protein